MSPPGLQVTPDGLRAFAQRCQTLADQVSAAPTPVTASAWQSSATGVNSANAGVDRAATTLGTRMRTTGNKLNQAAGEYVTTDGQAGATLSGLDFNPDDGHPSSGDGGAADLGADPTTPFDLPGGYPDIDGGAAALDTPE